MLIRTLRIAAVALATLSTRAFGGTNDKPEASAKSIPLLGKPGCFWLRNFYDWIVLDDSNLLVHAPPTRDAYQVKLFQPVSGLSFRLKLPFQDVGRTGSLTTDQGASRSWRFMSLR